MPGLKTNLQESFAELIENVFINYNGCLVERVGKEYMWNGKIGSWDEVTSRINESKKALQNSFNRNKKLNHL